MLPTAESYFQIAIDHHNQGQLQLAVENYLKATEIKPDFAEAYYNAGLVFQTLTRYDEALRCYRNALSHRPEYIEALNNMGQVLAATGDYEQSEATFMQAKCLNSEFAEPHFNLGELAQKQGRTTAAIQNFRQAIKLQPDMVSAYNNLGNAFRAKADLESARKCYQKVVELLPDLAEGHYNLGSVLSDLGNFEAAIHHLNAALRLRPEYPEALNNLALVYKNSGDLRTATRYFDQAVNLRPDFADARWNRSFTYLLTGDFINGWNDFEWRFKQTKWKSLYPFRLKQPRWDGSANNHLTILVHDEQGLGDTFQFVRYLPLVKNRCGTVILETRRALMPLLEGFAGIDQLIERSDDGRPAASFDCYIPLLSLPYIFQTRAETVPVSIPYLSPDTDKSADWQQRLSGEGFKVGIVWAGRPAHMNDKNRSCGLAPFSTLTDIPRIRWYGLQKGPAASQVVDWPDSGQFLNLGERFDDFTDTAAAIDNLDLVISVDTSVAHLAGAMGKTVWLLLPYIPDWRWMMEREDTPWYPTMRLFRQSSTRDWDSVFSRVRSELIRVAATQGDV